MLSSGGSVSCCFVARGQKSVGKTVVPVSACCPRLFFQVCCWTQLFLGHYKLQAVYVKPNWQNKAPGRQGGHHLVFSLVLSLGPCFLSLSVLAGHFATFVGWAAAKTHNMLFFLEPPSVASHSAPDVCLRKPLEASYPCESSGRLQTRPS